MKYNQEIEINLPRNRVIELFDNPDNMSSWQPELVSFENISGTPGQEGAKSRLKYKMGKREVELIETVTRRALPDEFTGTYETKGVFNRISNFFREVDGQKTIWRAENEFEFSGMMKMMAMFAPGMFKKQSYKYMQLFKEFAEGA